MPVQKWRRNPESNRGTRICNPLHSHSAIPPCKKTCKTAVPVISIYGLCFYCAEFSRPETKKPCLIRVSSKNGAGNEIRTRDLNLGKVALYQLSYSRMFLAARYSILSARPVKQDYLYQGVNHSIYSSAGAFLPVFSP